MSLPLASVLGAEELDRRPARPPDHARENRALVALAQALVASQHTILQTLVETILEVLEVGSVGLSLLSEDGTSCHWPAIAGAWKSHIGGAALPLTPETDECLQVPFHLGGKEVGTIWVVTHDQRRQLDGEDLRILVSLGSFASAAYQTVEHVRAVSDQAAEIVEAEHRTSGKLEYLYEISKLFASFETVEQTFDPALAVLARALPLRSAILIEAEGDHCRMIVWSSEGQRAEELRAAKDHAEAAYTYLVGGASTTTGAISEEVGQTALPPQAAAGAGVVTRFIVIPLVVAHRPAFGALQLVGVQPLDRADLRFVNAITNQLAIALDRDRARRRDVTRRERAEDGQVSAEQGRLVAEDASVKYEALAAQNAELYAEAQRAVRVREQILAIVSHDLKNPLGTVLMASEALAASGDHLQTAGRIQRAATRMLRQIDDLLDFASIEAGQLAIKRKPQDPGSIIQEAFGTFEGVAQVKGLQLTFEVEPYLPKVYCDHDRIMQVLANLLGNATKATAEGGHIKLRVEAREHELLFAVSDSGPGISPEDLSHLFERYWRSGDVEYAGTGLGLAIARGIVSAHGGRIWAESELGAGSTFRFTVPAADVTFLFAEPTPGDLTGQET